MSKPTDGGTRYRDIVRVLAREISVRYKPGDMMPSEVELAKRFSVSPNTASRAVKVLGERGFVQRYHRRGTVVVDRMATGEVAIVVRPGLLSADAGSYYRTAVAALTQVLHEQLPHWQVRLHMGKATPTGFEFAESLDLTQEHVLQHLRGVITFHRLFEMGERLERAGVPVVFTGRQGRYHVWFDDDQCCELMLRHLAEVGCRRICFVIHLMFSGEEERALREQIVGLGTELGMDCQVVPVFYGHKGITEASAYDFFMDYWREGNRPDAILTLDDVFCSGVLRAVGALGLELPEDLRLVTRTNKDFVLPYGKPVTRVEVDPSEQARESVRMLEGLIKGRPVEDSVAIPGWLVRGATT